MYLRTKSHALFQTVTMLNWWVLEERGKNVLVWSTKWKKKTNPKLKNWAQRVSEEGKDGEKDPADLTPFAAMIIICKLKRTFPGAQCLYAESKEMVLWSCYKDVKDCDQEGDE